MRRNMENIQAILQEKISLLRNRLSMAQEYGHNTESVDQLIRRIETIRGALGETAKMVRIEKRKQVMAELMKKFKSN